MIADYHIHTSLSDGKVKSHKAYIQVALKKKINEIGFSEHLCLKEPDWSMKFSDLPLMVKRANSLKEKSKIPVKMGIELDYLPGFESELENVIKKNSFDYVIGVVHFIGDFGFDDSRNIAEYKKWNINKLYKAYFELIQKAANLKLFDIIGHPDIIKKYGFKPKNDIDDLLNETADVFKRNNVVIEINTSGLVKPCREIYPSKKFLEICLSKQIPITFGSDAHAPEEIGRYFDKATHMAKQVGYTKFVQFTKRKRKFVEI